MVMYSKKSSRSFLGGDECAEYGTSGAKDHEYVMDELIGD